MGPGGEERRGKRRPLPGTLAAWTLSLLMAPLLLGAGAGGGAHAFVTGPGLARARRAPLVVMRAGAEGKGPEEGNKERAMSRGEWVQGLAGAAGVGAVALGGQRAVRAAQEGQAPGAGQGGDVLARRPVLAERLYDTRRKSYLPVDPYLLRSNKALDQPVICVGEVHDDDCHHFAEYSILKAVHARHVAQGSPGQLAVGLEMFYRQHQPILDDFVFGGADARSLAALKDDTRWEETWGWKLSHYSKIFNYARMHGIRLCGLNVPQPVVKVVSQLGLEKVPPILKSKLPEVDLNNTAHRESFMAMMRYFSAMHGGASASGAKAAGAGPHSGGMSEESLWRMYEAQTLWDEYMAESASNYIKGAGSGARMVVMAGSNHIQNRYGVPDRITRRLGTPVFTVVPISVPFDPVSGLPVIGDDEGLKDMLQPAFADWLFFVEKEGAARQA